MWRGVVLILLCLLTFVVGLGQSAMTDSDEVYYAEAGREMIASGDWTTPYYNFEPRLQKPILFYWFIAATYQLAGVSEFGARLWSALAGVGLAFVAAGVARRWYGPAEGLLAGTIVATSFGVVPLARQSLPDTPLALLVSVAIWAAIEALSPRNAVATPGPRARRPARWLYLSAMAAALGMLTKGPVAVALPATVVIPLLWWQWRRDGVAWPASLRGRDVVLALVVFIVVAAPWYLAVIEAQGLDYARQFFIGENVERFATATYNRWRGWQYIPVIVAGLLPWTSFALLWIRPMADRLSGRRPWTPVDVRLLCWAAGPLVFFMASVGSQPRYILPCLVPLAILLARAIWTRASVPAVSPRRDVFFRATMLAGGLMVLLSALLWRAASQFAASGAPVTVIGPAVMTTIGMVTTVCLLFAPRRSVPVVVGISAAALLIVFQSSVLSPARPEPVETIAEAVRAQGPIDGVCACGAFARTLTFYTHRKTQIANVTTEDASEMVQFLAAPGRVVATVDAATLSVAEGRLGQRFPRLAEVTYLNTSVWMRGETLYRPDLAWVQHVILVANR